MSIWGKARDVFRRVVRGKRAQPAPGVSPPTPEPKAPRPGKTGRPRRGLSIDELADELYTLGVASGDSHGAINLHTLTDAVGIPNARTVLRNQVQSTNSWMRGSAEPGRTRWFDREEWMRDHLKPGGEMPYDIDVFFWYHSKRGQ